MGVVFALAPSLQSFWSYFSTGLYRPLLIVPPGDSNIAAAAVSFQSRPTLCDPIDSGLPGSSVPGILQARVCCHFLLQCIKVESESEVSQCCPTRRLLVHGIFQARVLEWVAIDSNVGPGSKSTVPQ